MNFFKNMLIDNKKNFITIITIIILLIFNAIVIGMLNQDRAIAKTDLTSEKLNYGRASRKNIRLNKKGRFARILDEKEDNIEDELEENGDESEEKEIDKKLDIIEENWKEEMSESPSYDNRPIEKNLAASGSTSSSNSNTNNFDNESASKPVSNPNSEKKEKKEPIITIKKTTSTEPIPFDTIIQKVDSLEEGKEKIIQEGVEGVLTISYEETYENGKQIKKEQINSEVTRPAQDEIIEVGTFVEDGAIDEEENPEKPNKNDAESESNVEKK